VKIDHQVGQRYDNDHLFLSNRSPIIDKNNCVIGAAAILQDISELESISDELRRVKTLNKEFDVIFESSFDGIWLSDWRKSTVLS
jgi:sensor histidine kinase regulating citrate/malate metabolism